MLLLARSLCNISNINTDFIHVPKLVAIRDFAWVAQKTGRSSLKNLQGSQSTDGFVLIFRAVEFHESTWNPNKVGEGSKKEHKSH